MPVVARRPNLRTPQPYEPARPIKGLGNTTKARRFVARLSDDDAPTHDSVEASDFMQAALAFAETCAADRPDETLKIAVTDAETGETHCFNLDVAA